MKYRDLTNKNGIEQDVWFLTHSTSASYPVLDVMRNVNEEYKNVARHIWEVAYGWQYDDTNQTTLPIASTTLVNNQQDYEMPSTAQRIYRVEVKDSNGNFQLIPPIDQADVTQAMSEFMKTAGMPQYWDIVGRSLMFYPTPVSGSGGVTLSAGLKIMVDRDINLYVSTQGSLSTQPGFAAPFHRILSLAAALDYEEDEKQRAKFMNQKATLENGLERFYGKRDVPYKTKINPKGKKRWRQYDSSGSTGMGGGYGYY